MGYSGPEQKRAVVDRRLRRVLMLVFFLTGLLVVNSVYLLAVTLLEQAGAGDLQGQLYLVMFLLHLLLGLLLLVPLLLFGFRHLRRAWRRPNRYAVRAGLALFISANLLLLSGVLLTRFGFLEIDDPRWRSLLYWTHVLLPLVVAWLFVLHRLAGRGVDWRIGGRWGLVTLLFLGVMLLPPLLGGEAEEAGQIRYSPSFATVSGEVPIEPQRLMQDQVCAECHQDIAAQAALSMHRFSSFNNPAYRFSVEEARQVLLQRDGDVRVARLCAACHDQVPLFSGRFDDPDYDMDAGPDGRAGITCIGCHAISGIDSPLGNGAYHFSDPPRYPFAFSDNPLLQAINRQLIKAKPGLHKKTFLKPLHQSALFCSSCHKVHLPYALNHYRWLRGQDHYDSFLQSGVSGHRVDSFYYPPQTIENCAHCHMPLTASDDPAARDFDGSGRRRVHSHLFPAANTALPQMLGTAEAGNAQRQAMLQKAARVDIFGIKEGGDVDGRLLAPLRPDLPALQPGRRYLVETVIRTLGVGHQLTQGTSDSNELWLEVKVTANGRAIGRSGALDAQGRVDPWAYFLNAYLLDREGKRIERRNAQDIFVALYDHQIPPGAASVVHFGFQLPEGVSGPLTLEVSLNYRKFDSRFLGHVRGDEVAGFNDLPITRMASDRLVLPVAAGEAPDQQRGIAAWERWNDYGIGLLRAGGKGAARGELRQAEAAFREVEALAPGPGALNLARVYLKEGRLQEAAAALRRAAREPDAPPWTLAWLSARVQHENGNLQQAMQLLEDLVETRYQAARERGFDFSRDTRLLNELGRISYERSRQMRGERRREQREALLQEARQWLQRSLAIDPENLAAHYSLSLVEAGLGNREAARRHQRLHERYRPDDNAVEQAVTRHRRQVPAANHAAQPIAIYDLQRAEGSAPDAAVAVRVTLRDRVTRSEP